ncbi:MAG: S8 family serine peptidase [Opitutaceae bacterium]|jgi:outer membrane protein assembly factor BamB/subtilisin family serine protease
MPRRLLILLAIAALPIAAHAQTANGHQFTAKEIAQGWCDGTVLAKPRQERLATVDNEEANEGWTVERKFERFGGLRVFALKSGDTSDAAIARLRATGRYEFVDRDYLKRTHATASGPPNDPDFSMQWGLNNTGSNPGISGPGIAGADIHAVSSWTNTRTDASGVVVAIVDSGARLTHQDLAGNLWTNPTPNGTTSGGFRYVNALHGINAAVQSGSSNSGNPTDDSGHGTHVAGIVGAVGNNGVDGSGVAWSVQLMPLKFIETDTGSTTDEIICLDFALANGAQILNGSFGSSAYDPSEYAALKALDGAGVILVFAAGNKAEDNGLSPSYPASYNLSNIVAVAASDNRDDVIFFSSYGSGNVDLGSPGYEILSTYNTGDTATAILSGTSMATPFVTGSLALLKAQFPGDTPRQLINRLLRHVDPDFNFNGRVQTGGRLDLAAALASAPADNTPFNDDFASRAQLSGSSLSVRSSNVGATREAGEPLIGGNPGGASLWWQWTAPASGSVTLSTAGSGYPTLVGVYTGASLGSLTPVAANATAGTGASSVTFVAQAGTTYELTVDGQNGASGLTAFLLNYNNDAFELPTTLAGASTGITSTTRYATRESGEPQILPQYAGGHSVWYAWTAPKSGQFQVSAFSYDFDPLLAVYTGSSLTALTQLPGAAVGGPIVSADNIPASICLCTIQATAGTTYMITVDGAGDSTTGLSDGQFTLSIADSLWQGVTQDSITCAPAVGPNGTVYVGSDDDVFYAFNPDGSSLWTSFVGEPFDTTAAAIAGDGTVYAASSIGGPIYAFTAGGVLKWTMSLPGSAIVNGAAALATVSAADDTLYVKAQDGNLYAINTGNGSVKWTYAVPGVSYAPPSVGSDGTVYIGADNSVLYAISPYGTKEWTYTADAAIFTAPALDGSGNLYFGTLGGTFYSLGRSGALRWSFKANNSISSSPALGPNGVVYFGSYDHHLYALATGNGALQWSYLLGSEVRASSPAIDSNGVVYVGCYDDNVYAINPDGSLNRTFATAGWVRSSPVISGTNLYFGSYDHKLYAFNIGAAAASSPWPMLLNNAQRQGRAAGAPPSITTQPASQTVDAGSSPTLSVAAAGAINYQWQLNGTSIAGATNSSLTLANIGTAQAGSYTVVATNPAGSTTSSPASVTVNANSYLYNISSRAYLGSGPFQNIVAGFYTEGSGTKNVVVCGMGPDLAAIDPALGGLNLTSPKLTLINGSSATLVTNSAWGGAPALTSELASVYATPPVLPANSSDAAAFMGIPAGSGIGYTAEVDGLNNNTGIALVEVYDYDSYTTVAPSSHLINISTRAFVGPGNDALVAGFYIFGSTSQTLLVRAVGPGLAAANPALSGLTLATPTLTLFDLTGAIIATNTGWGNAPARGNSTVSAGLQPATTAIMGGVYASPIAAGSTDCAMVVTLPANTGYTVQVNGVGSTTGIALVEVYNIP